MGSRNWVAVVLAASVVTAAGFAPGVMAASVHASHVGILAGLSDAHTPADEGVHGLSGLAQTRSGHHGASASRPVFFLANSITGESWEWSPGRDNDIRPGRLMKTILAEGTIDRRALHFSVVPAASAVPVPAAVWLFASGLIGLAGVARQKR